MMSCIVMVLIVMGLAPAAAWRELRPGLSKGVTSPPRFEHIIVDASESRPLNPWGKAIGDLNKDGRPDLITGGQKAGGLVWYENTGDMRQWRRHLIAEGAGFSTDHEVADLDRDGDLDLISINDGLRWYENLDGRAETWARHDINPVPSHDVEVADLDGDGRLDLIARDQMEWGDGSKVFVLRQNPDGTFSAPRPLEVPDGEGLLVVDLDEDKKPDIVVNQVWLKNRNSSGSADQWSAHTYTSSYTWANTFIAVGDFNGDGRGDLAVSPSERDHDKGKRISWLEAPVDRTATWTEHAVVENLQAVWHFVGAADLDGDGRVDIASAEMNQGDDPDDVSIFLNRDGGQSWKRLDVATTGSHSMRMVDLNGDGRIDLFGANWNTSLDPRGAPVEIWINREPGLPAVP